MSRHFPLLVLLTVISPLITLHYMLTVRLDQFMSPSVPVATIDMPASTLEPEKPDFSTIESVPERKSQFFDFIEQFVDQRNSEILRLRSRILSQDYAEADLQTWAKLYRVKWTTPEEVYGKLLKKVDAVPASLVLAQAALESAWGTSRFAARGNNFFGQWCHSSGCGMVPNRRHQGLSHEVQIFESPFDSVAAYMRNLNSHPAYKGFREKRAELRAQREALNGCYLAQGLVQYSELGDTYIENVKLLIRANHLEKDPKGYCAPMAIAQQMPETAEAKPPTPQTLAADQAQQEALPTQPAEGVPPG